ncbi:rac GTPase-activating protein 1-like [Rhea pennata]|uniref:rac GTPase-activating protein 1-like n=1 Tax=Rhea pennata TaxID=8795 RepID=UPI002E253CFD
MMRQRYGHLLAQLERVLRLLELSGGVEEDYIQIARCFEVTRQKCCRLEQDGRRAREQLARAEAERAALEVKLKHARNQVEVEMKKRHRAEAELEKQERKLQLIFEFLMQEPSGSSALTGEQRTVLCALAGRRLGGTLVPGRRSSVVDESCHSLLSHSDISYDRTEDDVDVDVTVVKTLKRRTQERQRTSLAPQIGPVLAAKRLRPSVVPPNAVKLTTAWGAGEDRGCRAAGPESRAEQEEEEEGGVGQAAPLPSPPHSLPLLQHQFGSKTVIRPEPCAACGSRLRFGTAACKCRRCRWLVHARCRQRCPGPCAARPRRRGRPREGVLADLAPAAPPRVPALLVRCVAEVEARGLAETGLYRVPGAEQLVREWKRRLLRAGEAPGAVADVHVLCGVLKDFLRGLREPLLTLRLRPAFLQAADVPDEAACGAALRHLVSQLPPANRDTLAFLMLHLQRVSRSPDCRMDVPNLSRVFGPTLVGHGSANPTPLAIIEDTPRQCKVVARLLSLPPDFWGRFVGTEQENLVLVPASTPAPQSEHGEAPGRARGAPPGGGRPRAAGAEGPWVPKGGWSVTAHVVPCPGPRPAEQLFCPVASAEPNSGQLSPAGTCCLPSALRSCVGTAPQPPQEPAPKRVGRFFPSLV